MSFLSDHQLDPTGPRHVIKFRAVSSLDSSLDSDERNLIADGILGSATSRSAWNM